MTAAFTAPQQPLPAPIQERFRHFPCLAGLPASFVHTSALRRYANPFETHFPLDLDVPLTLGEIQACLDSGVSPWHAPAHFADNDLVSSYERAYRRQAHVEQVAWFVRKGFEDSIRADVDLSLHGQRPVVTIFEGWHQFCAAAFWLEVYGEDRKIPLQISGSVRRAVELGLLPLNVCAVQPDAHIERIEWCEPPAPQAQ